MERGEGKVVKMLSEIVKSLLTLHAIISMALSAIPINLIQ